MQNADIQTNDKKNDIVMIKHKLNILLVKINLPVTISFVVNGLLQIV